MIWLLSTIFLLALLAFAFWAGHEWGKCRYRAPVRKAAHTDEYLVLKDGAFVPYQPPKYVPEGMSPVAATWEITRQTSIPHHTRRVGD